MAAPSRGRRGAGKKRPPHEPAARRDAAWMRRAPWLFLAAALLATLLFFAAFVTDRGAMVFGTDMVSQAYQSRAFAVQEVAAGRGLPRWNPFVYGGVPYLSALPYPVYYPTSLLYFVIPLHRAIGWAFVLHFLLAGVVAYALARELELAPGAAALTGAAYMFTGYIASHLYAGQDGRMFAMQWTPALFLFAERAVRRRRLHWFGWMAVVAALQTLTPHVQMMYFAALGLTAYVAFRLVQTYRADRAWKPVAALAAGFAGAYAAAGLVTLVEVLPTWNMLQFSHRAARGYDYASSWSMPVQETLAAVWPRFQGSLDAYWGTNPFKLHTEYLGAVPVLLATLALAARRTARAWFFAALAVGALLFAWGDATPVHRIAYWTLPIMKSFRAPAMMFSLVALATAVLAGHGAQALYDRRESLAEARHPAWKALAGLGLIWLVAWFWAGSSPLGFGRAISHALYGTLDPPHAAARDRAMRAFAPSLGVFVVFWWAGLGVVWGAARGRLTPLVACCLLALATVADLWRVDDDFLRTVPVARLTTPDAAVRRLQSAPEPFRALPLPDAYGPNDLMLFRIPTVTGSQNFRLRWWDDLVGEDLARLGDTRLWRVLDLRYVVTGQSLEMPGLEPLPEAGGPTVYRWGGALGGAWVVHRAEPRPPGSAGEALLDPGFDPAVTALLEPGVTPPALAPDRGPARVGWVTREPDRLVLDVDDPAGGLLVLSEIYHPYWRATVDGRPAPVERVDVALRGVPLPAGPHRVELAFDDPYLTYGAWGSLAGSLLLIGFLGLTWRRRAAPEGGK